MSVDVVVIGAGGFGRETLDVIEAHNSALRSTRTKQLQLRVTGVVDDRPSGEDLGRLHSRGYRYLGTVDQVLEVYRPSRFVLAIGNPKIKVAIDEKFVRAGWRATSVIHPAATIGSQSHLGEGNIVCAGAQISTNVQFGRHVHVNPNATIGHDSVLMDFVSVNPAAVISGDVIIRENSLIGASSVILQGTTMGEFCTIGASACVLSDVKSHTTVVGVPARPVETEPSRASHASKHGVER